MLKRKQDCKSCINYCDVEDMISRMYAIENPTSTHYCEIFDDGIDDKVWEGKKSCPYYLYYDQSKQKED